MYQAVNRIDDNRCTDEISADDNGIEEGKGRKINVRNLASNKNLGRRVAGAGAVAAILCFAVIGIVIMFTKKSKTSRSTITYQCPESAGDTLVVDKALHSSILGLMVVEKSGNISRLCTLTKQNSITKAVTPIARSYDGNLWEQSPGPYAAKIFSSSKIYCSNNIFSQSLAICNMELPVLSKNEHYILSTHEHSLSQRNEIARFLEQMTFGPTIDSIAALEATGADFEKWVANQMTLPGTSHRAYWRKRTNPKWTTPQPTGHSDHPCSPNSRWRKYAFTRKDRVDTYKLPPEYRSMKVTHLKDQSYFPDPYQAELASYNSSYVSVKSRPSGYSGDGYIEMSGKGPSAYVEWVFESPVNDEYNLGIRYALGTNSARPVDIAINGKTISYNLNLPRTPGWNNWGYYLIENVSLVLGNNTVRISCIDGTSGPKLDYLRVSSPSLLSIDGYARTVVPALLLMDDEFADYAFDQNYEYEFCAHPYAPQIRYPNGRLRLEIESGECVEVDRNTIGNPQVDFAGYNDLAQFVFEFDEAETSSLVASIDNLDYYNVEPNQELLLPGGLDSSAHPLCNNIPDIAHQSDAPVFAHLTDGTWIQWDPKIKLEENTIDSPIPDGGGKTTILTGDKTTCMNTPRNFWNEDGCILSTDESTCSLSVPAPQTDIILDYDNVTRFFSLTEGTENGNTRYVYAIRGLVVKDSPCVLETSRWELLADTTCTNPSNLMGGTMNTFTQLLSDSGNNPFIRDIQVGDEICNTDGFDPAQIEVQVGGNCFKHVHPSHLSVYDMTEWSNGDAHPGNVQAESSGHEHPIKKWAPGWYLIYPSSHPTDPSFDHPMSRWDSHNSKFDYVGRLGDSIQFRDLPNNLKTTDIAAYYDVPLEASGPGLLVCGSSNEVSNDPSLWSMFDLRSPYQDTTSSINFERQKKVVWSTIAMFEDDQLCQRMAWALAQILVVVTETDMTEPFLGYYDIMVRNCFGNYRDILREISYSPLMAEHLSYVDSRSHAYVYETKGEITYADENFAREIMQLFTTGLIRLNQDGTPQLDSKGKEIEVYSNEDIMSFARAWTGFRKYQDRGNVENQQSCSSCNNQDPMFIDKDRRDIFPKSDLLGGYIGDRYPLCVDLPSRMFLRKGAKYRFLGSNSLPELIEDNKKFANDPAIKRMVLDPASTLYQKLFNGGKYLNNVVLEANHDCYLDECKVDTVRVVEVEGLYYEYVRPACVEQAFYEGGKKLIKDNTFNRPNTCANPQLPYAMEACCPVDATGSKIVAIRNYVYDGERMTFESASERCAAIERKLCDFRVIDDSTPEFKTGFHWTTTDCSIEVKIDQEGNVAMVYDIENRRGRQALHISEESWNYFKVYWENGEYPNTSNNCGGVTGCTSLAGGGCQCKTAISEDAVFSSKPSSADEILSTLVVGAMDPGSFDDGKFIKQEESDFTAYLLDGVYDGNTIFEVTNGMSQTFFLKNIYSTVNIVGGRFNFRNAPHFMSMIADAFPYGIGETTRRDAEYETEAVLDHYFYHPNVAPFICTHFIKRFGISNPSPRYVETCADAFFHGSYASQSQVYGSGTYGDLSALIASISLDREARSFVLDADPTFGSVREPILKVLGLMRALDFQVDDRFPTVQLFDMNEKIGQMAHSFETVFSFFLADHIPNNGPLNSGSLTSPESIKLEMPLTIGLLNGIFSLVKYGLSDCDNGFGIDLGSGGCNDDGLYTKSLGALNFGLKTVSSRVSASSDDAEERIDGGSVDLLSRDLDLGRDRFDHWVGMRFNNINIPKEAKIIGAYIEFEVDEANDGAASFTIHGQAADNPPAFSTEDYNISKRSLTSADVSWNDIPVWEKVSDRHKTPDLSPILQELVKRSGWIAGNSVAVIISGPGKRVAEAWDGEPDNAPLLVVTYSTDNDPTPTGRSTVEIVDNLSTLLTAGRLSSESKEKIVKAVKRTGGDVQAGVRLAEQLIATTPEFHTTGLSAPSSEKRQEQSAQPSSVDGYKSLVYLYFDGGCDSFNLLSPHTCPSTIDQVSGNITSTYEKYLAIRERVALTSDLSLKIDADTSLQPCTSFGIHPSLPVLRDLYNEKSALFVANTGLLLRPVDKTNYKEQTPTQLFAHNTMSRETKQVDLNEEISGTGVVGRLNDALKNVGYSTNMFSISGNTITLAGQPGINPAQSVLGRTGLDSFNPNPSVSGMDEMIKDLNNAANGFMAETWSSELYKAMDQHSTLYGALEQVSNSKEFPDTKLGERLSTVAELMQTHKQRGSNRDLFYVSMGGFDTHSDVGPDLAARFDEVNSALSAFVGELKAQDLWVNTTLVEFSDFARTLRPNSGNGTDHGWGQNIFAVGGSLNGGKIMGNYPDEFGEESPIGLTRGRLIPTTPFDAIWNGIAQWYGVTTDIALDTVLPMRKNFPANRIFNASDLYL